VEGDGIFFAEVYDGEVPADDCVNFSFDFFDDFFNSF